MQIKVQKLILKPWWTLVFYNWKNKLVIVKNSKSLFSLHSSTIMQSKLSIPNLRHASKPCFAPILWRYWWIFIVRISKSGLSNKNQNWLIGPRRFLSLRKVPRFPFKNNLSLKSNEKRWFYVRQTSGPAFTAWVKLRCPFSWISLTWRILLVERRTCACNAESRYRRLKTKKLCRSS